MASAAGMDVLLIDDDEEEAELALLALKTAWGGAKVVHAANGQEALDLLFGAAPGAERARSAPRVVLLDLKMPEMDGFQVLQRIKSDRRTKTIPVVILTSSQLESDIRGSYDLGANGYIIKSCDYGAFLEAMTGFGRYWLGVNRPSAL